RADVNRETASAADDLRRTISLQIVTEGENQFRVRLDADSPKLNDYDASLNPVIRVVFRTGEVVAQTTNAPYLPPPRTLREDYAGYRIESRPIPTSAGTFFVQYARRLSDVDASANRVRVFLGLGVLGGAALALLAGLATATRAMAPITRLTDTARTIARTRDPSLTIPHPESSDEVSELASTLESMLYALNEARGETEATLARQRQFVADASHELRTPLTSVLANLELLEMELEGEQREAAASALRSSRRMRRLVADLLLLARADAGRMAPRVPVDLSEVVTEAAGELEPVAGDHQISVSAPPGAELEGARDELHRLTLNLLENALRHTDPGTAVEATVERIDGEIVLSVEDDGPGISPELRDKVFERFFRGDGDRSGSSGLGLSIVQAVADSHDGTVSLEEPLDGRGARFVVRFPARR
ncbi:MAG TPA: HAMP domain-containing sensor histidine kinase, partial [Solirubrobacteraceae bacterium]|nr:HAMP domain-containing sensor histidine kinase [Solirubrobacteraceae bacterium]